MSRGVGQGEVRPPVRAPEPVHEEVTFEVNPPFHVGGQVACVAVCRWSPGKGVALYAVPMGNDRRVRRLMSDGAVWHWTVRQRVRPDYPDCRVTLSLLAEATGQGVRRRLALVFAPGPDRIISNSSFEAGTVMRLPDHAHLNLYEPMTVRRLLDAAAPVLDLQPSARSLEVNGWPSFDDVVDRPHTAEART